MRRYRKPISVKKRFQVFVRDRFRCRYCGVQGGEGSGVVLHVDHLVSVADGGTDEMDNLVCACRRCNLGKSSLSLRELPDAERLAAQKTERFRRQAGTVRIEAEVLKEWTQATIEYVGFLVCPKAMNLESPQYMEFVRFTLRLTEKYGFRTVQDWQEQVRRLRKQSKLINRRS